MDIEGGASPQLRLFTSDAPQTLYELYIERWQSQRHKSTAYEDRRALKVFEELIGAIPAKEITSTHCWQFRKKLDEKIKAGEVKQNTADKWVRSVSHILKLAGPNDGSIDPEDYTELQPAGVIQTQLRLKRFGQAESDCEKLIEMEESEQFLTWLAWADWVDPKTNSPLLDPPLLPATVWWRNVWILCYNSALRIEELCLWRRDWIEKDRGHWWARLPAEGTKTKTPRSVYLNAHALAAIEQLKPLESRTVIGWTYSDDFLGKLRRKFFERAGLMRCVREGIGFHGLRKACATELAKMAGHEIAAMHLGHKLQSVTAKHYVNRVAVIPHVDQLPQPRIIEPADPQRRLFD